MFLGCDIGTGYTKAVLIDKEGTIMASDIIATEADPKNAGDEILKRVLNAASIGLNDINACFSTGWGRAYVNIEHREKGMMNCLAKGANSVLPSCRTLLDIGAQHSMAISVDDRGNVVEFRQNDRCAAGSGRFVEVISEALHVPLEEVSDYAMRSQENITVTAQCAVFAESEVIALVNDGKSQEAILAGILNSLARGIVTLAKRLSIQNDILVSGGLAKNKALVNDIEMNLENRVNIASPDPQLLAAFGAALLAKEEGE